MGKKTNRRLIILSQGYLFINSPQHQRVKAFVTSIKAELDIESIIISQGVNNNSIDVEVRSLPWLQVFFRKQSQKSDASSSHEINGTNSKISFFKQLFKKPRLSKLLSMCNKILYCVYTIVILLKVKRKTIAILSTSPSGITHLAALISNLISQSFWIVDFRDPWYLNPVEPDNVVISFVKRIVERWVVRYANACLFTTSATLENYVCRYPIYADKFIELMNGYDEDELSKVPICYKEKEPAQTVLCHTGFLGLSRPATPLLKAIDLLPYEFHNLRLIIAGQVDNQTKNLFQQANSEQIFYLGQVPRSKALEIAANSDWFVVIQYSQEQLPSKVFDAIGLRKPIFLISNGGITEEFIKKYNLGVCISLSSEDIAKVLIDITNRQEKILFPQDIEINKWSRYQQNYKLVQLLQAYKLS